VQPHGPYYLLGWSFGGNLAQEIAARLQAAGEEIGLLSILDSYPAAPEDGLESATEHQVFAALVGNMGFEVPADRPLDRAGVLAVYREAGNPMGSLSEEALGAMVRNFVSQAVLMRGFTPAHFDGEVLFFTALQGRDEDSPTLHEWLPYLSGIENHDVDAAHTRLTQPEALAQLGPVVAARLAQRQADTRAAAACSITGHHHSGETR
jgi:thioesterase domain-containing protein